MNRSYVSNTKRNLAGTSEVIDVAARHLVYKLYEATDRVRDAWHVLGKIGEQSATVARAVERGWIVTRDEVGSGKKKKLRSASLTSEGRLVLLSQKLSQKAAACVSGY
jgi:hypothetical protein